MTDFTYLFFSAALLPGTLTRSRLVLHVPYPSHGTGHYFQQRLSLFTEHRVEIWVWALGAPLTAGQATQTQHVSICVCTQLGVSLCRCLPPQSITRGTPAVSRSHSEALGPARAVHLQLQCTHVGLLKSPASTPTSAGKPYHLQCSACVGSLCLSSHSLYSFPKLSCHGLHFTQGSPKVVNDFFLICIH